MSTSALTAPAHARFFLVSWTVVFFLLPAAASGVSALPDGSAESTALSGSVGFSAPRQVDRDTVFAGGLPLQLDSELVRLFIEGDTLRVEGLYRFLCSSSESEFMSLFYPYPDDSLLGEASTVVLEGRTTGACRQPLDFVELPDNKGVRWKVPLTLGDTLDVRTVYRQTLLGSYARYIVTTARGWPRPLKHARFEVFLPDDAEHVSFSLPFKPTASPGRDYYLYEAWDFLPGCDIVVEWGPGVGGSKR